ncbi:iron-siderophore ABC transporter substrate-binding protein [Lentibacillus sediminis]|uniref:ABC transporter substrate-binding protein n=1 Tax=Lentibacillus sediminis TaxID=1940529 RepID=UPI003084624A
MKKIGLFLAILLLGVLAACGSTGEENESAGESSDTPNERSLSIEDAMGEQTIEGIPEDIVVLEWSYAENLLALGMQPAGVADVDGYNQWVNIDKELDDSVVDVGTRQEPNLEAISRLDPDLIIAVKYRHEAHLDALNDIAPVVTFAPYGEEAVQDQYQNMINEFEKMATIVDKEAEAEQVLTDLDSFVEEQKQRIAEAGLEGNSYIATQAFTAQNAPTLRLFTNNSIVAQVINSLGLENAYQSDTLETYGYSEVNVEALQNFQGENLEFLYIVQEEDNI